MRYLSKLIVAISLALSISACSNNRNSMNENTVPYLEHTVKYPGETLGEISKWYTGTAANWREILAFNPAMKATRIRLGDIVRIPRSLVIRDSPLPKRSASSASANKNTPKNSEGEINANQGDAAQELIAEEEQAGKGDSDSETQANTPAESMPPSDSAPSNLNQDNSLLQPENNQPPQQLEPTMVPPLAHDDITPNKVQMDPEKRTEEIKRTREELLRELGEQY